MKTISLLITVLVCSSPLFAQNKSNNILVTPEWVKQKLTDPKTVLIQVNGLKLDYDREHIPGARYLWPEWLAPNSPQGAYNVPDLKQATEVLQNLGINNDSHIIIYHVRNEIPSTARMFLTLEHLGLAGRVSFMNGGLDEWKKAGLPVTKELPQVKKGNVKAQPGNLIVDKDYVLKTMQSPKSLVVDARMKRFYDGEPVGNPRDGHITGAKNIPYTDLINKANKLKPLDSLQIYFSPVAEPGRELVTYCFIGQTASVVYLAGRLLGYDMKLYDGSLQEWSRIEELPMEKTVVQGQ
jgi:thiosulfate/3-mercaptopyruvate sulfurtransferase